MPNNHSNQLKEKVNNYRNQSQSHTPMPEYAKQERNNKLQFQAQSVDKDIKKQLKSEHRKLFHSLFGTKRPTAGIVQKHFES